MEFEPRGLQGWASIIRKGTPHGRTVAPHDFGFRITPSFEAPFNGAYPTDTLFACFLGMTVGVINGLCRLVEIMEVTELVWHIGEHFRDGTTDGQLAVRHDADKRHRHILTHGPEQDGQKTLVFPPARLRTWTQSSQNVRWHLRHLTIAREAP